MVADLLGSLQPRDTSGARRQMAMALMNQGRSTAPIQSPWQGLANLASAFVGGQMLSGVQNDEEARRKSKAATLAEALRLQAEGPSESRAALVDAPGPAMEGSGVEAGYSAPARPSGAKLAAALLGKNEDTAELGMKMMSQANADETSQQRDRERRTEDFRYRGMERADTQEFQRQQMAAQQAQAERMARLQAGLAAGNRTPVQIVKDGVPTWAMPQDAVGQPSYNPAVYDPVKALQVQKLQEEQAAAKRANVESVESIDRTLRTGRELQAHPGREMATGKSSFMSMIPGTDARDFQSNLEAFKSQNFIPAVSQLKGMGALSDAEGKKLLAAIGALDQNMTEEGFMKSLNDIIGDLEKARSRMPGAAQTGQPPAVGQPDRLDKAMGGGNSGGGLSPDEAAELAALRARFGGGK